MSECGKVLSTKGALAGHLIKIHHHPSGRPARGGEPEEGERTEEVEEIRKERLLEAYSAYCSANLHTPRPVPPRKIGENGETSIYGQKEKKEKTVEACEVRRHGQAF